MKFSWKHKGSFTALDQELALPAVEIAHFWRDSVRTRISQSGQGARGPLTRYKTESYSPVGDGRHWVPPTKPQPNKAGRVVQAGRFQGWAIYPSKTFYLRLLGKTGPRTLKQSGRWWASLVVVVIGQRTSIQFRGAEAQRRARELIDTERQGLLVPTDAEWEAMQRMARDAVADQVLGGARSGEGPQPIRVQAARGSTRLSTIQRRSAAGGIR